MVKGQPKFNILRDEPLTNKEADRFGYSDIAEKITDIIKNVKPPFTIGLYGQWGSGKTSICQLVENDLKEIDGFKVFYFDIWKYEKDSFRRQFLIQLDENLKLGLNFKSKLNQDLSILDPTQGEVKIDKKIILNPIGTVLILLCLVSLLLLIGTFLFQRLNQEWIRLLSSILFSSTFSGFVLQALVNSIVRVQKTITFYKTDSAEGFEERFSEVLNKIKNKKLLVIIDNLDRLTSENAISVLSDIKTFLAKDRSCNNTIFLIPCDNKAINDHLHKIYDSNFDADEFLRKFFNLTFKIPRLLDLELDDYILEKLKETKIPEFQENLPLSFLMMQAFRDNPREIIQFINSLTTLYLLAKHRGLIEVLNNIQFLAKILVIRQKWPIEYTEIENKILRTGLKLDEIVCEYDIKIEKYKNLWDFVQITSSIQTDTPDIFFSLQKSKQKETLPDWGSFILSAEEKRYKDLEHIYKEIKKNNNIPKLNSLLRDYLRKNKKNDTKILNVFISVVKILSINEKELLEDFKEFLSYSFEILNNPGIYIMNINDINFINLLSEKAIDTIPKEFYDKFLYTIIKVLTSTKNANQPSIDFNKGIELFELLSLDSIWSRIKKHHGSLEEAKNKFIQIINVNELINSDKRNELLNKFTNFILNIQPVTPLILPLSLNKINEIIINPAIGEDVWQVLKTTEKLLDKIQHPEAPDSFYITSVQNFSTTIINKYSQTTDWIKREILIKITFSLKEIKKNSLGGQLNNLIVDFISNINNPDERILNIISKEKFIEIIQKESIFKNAVIDRTKSLPDIFIRYDLKEYFSEQEIDAIIKSLIYNHEQILKFLEYLDFKLDENSRKWLIESMINVINNIPLEFFDKWLTAIKRLKINNYPDLIEKLRISLKETKQKGGEFNNLIKNFVSKNKKLFEGIVDELIK